MSSESIKSQKSGLLIKTYGSPRKLVFEFLKIGRERFIQIYEKKISKKKSLKRVIVLKK